MGAPDQAFAVINLSCPITVMRFYLVYSGPLPSSGNNSKPDDVKKIRDQFHPQMELLWRTHPALQRLKKTSRVARNPGEFLGGLDSPFEVFDTGSPLQEGFENLCEPLRRGEKTYIPLVRKSLDLTCSVDILFLRQEGPGSLILQGGEIDNRIKTLFDALRVPDADVEARYPQAQDTTYCLLENDTLVSGFQVSTGQLLIPRTDHANEVHLILDVTVRVLQVGAWNVCLVGE